MNQSPPQASTHFRSTLQFSRRQPILRKGQSRPILRREVAIEPLKTIEAIPVPSNNEVVPAGERALRLVP